VSFYVDGTVRHTAPCYESPTYLRFGVVAFQGGTAAASVDDIVVKMR
jgi:hypothetical protein